MLSPEIDIKCIFPYGLAVRIPGFHPGGRGSTPGMGNSVYFWQIPPTLYNYKFNSMPVPVSFVPRDQGTNQGGCGHNAMSQHLDDHATPEVTIICLVLFDSSKKIFENI